MDRCSSTVQTRNPSFVSRPGAPVLSNGKSHPPSEILSRTTAPETRKHATSVRQSPSSSTSSTTLSRAARLIVAKILPLVERLRVMSCFARVAEADRASGLKSTYCVEVLELARYQFLACKWSFRPTKLPNSGLMGNWGVLNSQPLGLLAGPAQAERSGFQGRLPKNAAAARAKQSSGESVRAPALKRPLSRSVTSLASLYRRLFLHHFFRHPSSLAHSLCHLDEYSPRLCFQS
jgi:hypothetical protein